MDLKMNMFPVRWAALSCSVLSDSLRLNGLSPARLLCPLEVLFYADMFFPGWKSLDSSGYVILNIHVFCPVSSGNNQSYTVQFSSVAQSCPTLQLHKSQHGQASLSITNSRSSLRLTSIESVMPSSHLILCHSLLLLPPFPPSIRVFSNESALCIRWPKYCSFSFSIIPSKEIPGLISFRMDWLDLLAAQGTLKSLLQHHSSKASILWHSAFFTVQLLYPYTTTGKTIALTRRTFVGKVMSYFWICCLGWS